MGRQWIGAIETLTDACRAQRMLWAFCLNCGHGERFDPRNLMALVGDASLRKLQQKLKCRRCTHRRAHVIPSDRPWPGRD
jgi:hypothetical protein